MFIWGAKENLQNLNLLKSGKKNSVDFGVGVINGIIIEHWITSIKVLELLNKQMLFIWINVGSQNREWTLRIQK